MHDLDVRSDPFLRLDNVGNDLRNVANRQIRDGHLQISIQNRTIGVGALALLCERFLQCLFRRVVHVFVPRPRGSRSRREDYQEPARREVTGHTAPQAPAWLPR